MALHAALNRHDGWTGSHCTVRRGVADVHRQLPSERGKRQRFYGGQRLAVLALR